MDNLYKIISINNDQELRDKNFIDRSDYKIGRLCRTISSARHADKLELVNVEYLDTGHHEYLIFGRLQKLNTYLGITKLI